MFKFQDIIFAADGKKMTYNYQVSGKAEVLFKTDIPLYVSYGQSITAVPESINIIPLLSNVMPIAWFAGFDVYVNEVDSDFYHALESIKSEFTKHYPQLASKQSKLHYNKLVNNSIDSQQTAMLFSGGVDAFATYFRHYSEKPQLITIQGADIELTDSKQWDEVKSFNANEPILKQSEKHYITTNFQEFYTHKVDFMLPNLGWWGNIQHGLALICVVAPLSFLEKYKNIYIASTRSIQMDFNPWGSMPEVDEKITWAGVTVVHDGFELKRQDKVDTIVAAVEKLGTHTTLRVCYSELKVGLNCSRCEKCIRTQIGIMMAGGDPNHYGFTTDASIYDMADNAVSKGFKSEGTRFFWTEIIEKANESNNIFVFSDAVKESEKRKSVLKKIEQVCKKELVKPSKAQKIKHVIINKYPRLFQYYLKARRSL